MLIGSGSELKFGLRLVGWLQGLGLGKDKDWVGVLDELFTLHIGSKPGRTL